MKKKILVWLLTLCAALSFAACGEKESQQGEQNQGAQKEEGTGNQPGKENGEDSDNQEDDFVQPELKEVTKFLLMEEKQLDKEENLISRTEYTYNEYGQIVTLTRYDSSNEVIYKTERTYNKRYQLETSKEYDGTGTLTAVSSYEHKAGEAIKVICKNADGTDAYEGRLDIFGNLAFGEGPVGMRATYVEADGRILVTASHDSTGTGVMLTRDYIYDETGRIDRKKDFAVNCFDQYVYDEHGNLIAIEEHQITGRGEWQEDNILDRTIYTYEEVTYLDTGSNLYESMKKEKIEVLSSLSKLEADGDVEERWTYYYDYQGHLCVSICYNDRDDMIAAENYAYDEDGNVSKVFVYSGPWYGLGTEYIGKKVHENGFIVREDRVDIAGNAVGYESYEYDANGNQVKVTTYEGDTVLEYREMAYDENGRCISAHTYEGDGDLIEYCNYEYDEKGNHTIADVFDEYGDYQYSYEWVYQDIYVLK